MIPDAKVMKIKSYFLRNLEGYKVGEQVLPVSGEQIKGVPYQWHSDNSEAYVQHIFDGKVYKTVSLHEIGEIIFDTALGDEHG